GSGRDNISVGITVETELRPERMTDVVEKQSVVSWSTAMLLLGHCLLALGVLLLFVLAFTCLRRYLRRSKSKAPLPTPPVCRRQLSVHSVYPPTPPITREQLSVYTICRPTPPDSPLISVKPTGKSASPISLFTVDTTAIQPRLSHTSPPLTPPLYPHHSNIRTTCPQLGASPHLPLRTSWSVPGRLYRLLES
ncbi:hypothetical protein OTU49_015584, partial [Cherax quadricarinatus]